MEGTDTHVGEVLNFRGQHKRRSRALDGVNTTPNHFDNNVETGIDDEDVIAKATDQRIITGTAIESVVAGTTDQSIGAGTAIEIVIAGAAVCKIGTKGATEEVRGSGAHITISGDVRGLRDQIFSIAGTIDKRHLNPQDGTHLGLSWGETGGGADDDPGASTIAGRLPGIRESAKAVYVSNGADINPQNEAFGG